MIPLSRHLKGRGRRKVFIIVVASTLALVIGGYALWCSDAWANYHAAYGNLQRAAKSSIDTALKMPATSTKERVAKLEALQTVARSVDEGRDKMSCSVNVLMSWQQSVSVSYKKWREECEAVRTSIGALNAELRSVAAYTKNDQELADTLTIALGATDKKVTEGSFSSVLSKWQIASAATKKMDVSRDFAPVRAKAQVAIDGIVTAWRALVAAHAVKDEAKYEKAVKAVVDAYSTVDAIKQESAKGAVTMGETVQVRYHDAFQA